MSKEDFIDGYREELMKNSPFIQAQFDRAKTDKDRDFLKKTLDYSLGKSYDEYAKDYFDSKGMGSYVSTFLRTTGALSDAVGTYMFWALGGAGFGFKGVGLLEKTVADTIDEAHYIRHAKHDKLTDTLKDQGKIVSEGLAERAAAYLPLGVGEVADLLRGKNKYDSKVTNYALERAKDNFYEYVRRPDELKIASIDRFKAKPDRHRIDEKATAA